MNVEQLPLRDALRITPAVFTDARGYFKEIYSGSRYRSVGVPDAFVQDNVSTSAHNVLRGLHSDPRMAKLVQALHGEIYDVIVDVRTASPSFGRWFGALLRSEEHTQIYVPPGFLHGFYTLSATATVLYKQSAEYDPASEIGVAWNDPDLAIAWPLDGRTPLLSPKDAANPTLRARGLL